MAPFPPPKPLATTMTLGVGGHAPEDVLKSLDDRTGDVRPIAEAEFQARIAAARERMRAAGIDALLLYPGSSLAYFTNTSWRPSERLVAAVLAADGDAELAYVAPAFEEGTLASYLGLPGVLHLWQEHEDPYALTAELLRGLGVARGAVALDPATPFFTYRGLQRALAPVELVDAEPVIAAARRCKSPAELALMQRAKDMTLEVQRCAAQILRPGISTAEVTEFIDAAHRALGAPAGSSFCIVLFGPDSAIPHGVKTPKRLDEGDVVLIDTGCTLHGYQSDITRTYVFGEPTARQRTVWEAEQRAQAAAFDAAQIGASCASVDAAARAQLERDGFGPGYELPGLPHRTGHGIGLDIHESPYLVGSDLTPLAPGMCFSNEPMICVPGEFGVRFEDHFYMTATGPRWFTQPSPSVDDPFALQSP